MARALPPASFVREAPNNQSALPMTATGHCPVPVLPRRAKTSFPGREAAPLRFAAPSAWVQKGSWAGLRSASASAVTLCYGRMAPRPSWLARPPQQRHCPPTHACCEPLVGLGGFPIRTLVGGIVVVAVAPCYDQPVDNRTEPRTARQWIRYLVVAVIALFLVWWMLRVYVL